MNFLKKMVVILIAIQNNFNPFSRNIKPTYLNKFGNVPFSHVYSTNYGKTQQITLEIMRTLGQTDLPLKIEKDKNTDNNEENNRDNREFFEILVYRCILGHTYLCLLYFLYKEDVHDEMLFFALILLLIS